MTSNEEVAIVDAYFSEQDIIFYLDGLKRLEHHWKKCIDLKREYAEK